MVVIRGVNVYPSAIEQLIREFPEVSEYRVTLDQLSALPELSIEIEASTSIASLVSQRLQSTLALRIPVESVPAGSLPRFELKAKRWRRIR
jgi:phenylacetate-CoA ligase